MGAENRGPLALPGWRIVVGGQSGAGKTTFCMRFIRAVVLAETFLEWRGYGGRALVIDLEQGLRTVQRRLTEAGLQDCDDVHYARIPDGLALDQHVDQREWLEGVLRHGADGNGPYDVVLIDPLYKLHQGEGDERGMIDLMRVLDRWREDFGFCLLLPAHLRKADKTGRTQLGMDDISGSGAIVRGAEVVLGVQLLAGMPESGEGFGKSRLHFWKDRDGDLPVSQKWQLSFRPDRGFSVDEAVVETTADKIRKLLANSFPEPMSLAHLASATGKSERTCKRSIEELKAEDLAVGEVVGAHGVKFYRLKEVYDPAMEGWE